MHFHIIKYTHSFHHTRIFFPHFVGVFIYAGAINRPLRLLTDCQLRGEHSAKCQRTIREMRNEHPARRRGRFTAHAYPHYQIRIFTLLNTCFRFNAHTYPHYQLRVFTLLNTYIHFTEYVHLHYRTRIFTPPHAHFRHPFCG